MKITATPHLTPINTYVYNREKMIKQVKMQQIHK